MALTRIIPFDHHDAALLNAAGFTCTHYTTDASDEAPGSVSTQYEVWERIDAVTRQRQEIVVCDEEVIDTYDGALSQHYKHPLSLAL